jgi:S1-C subfamily serine protease
MLEHVMSSYENETFPGPPTPNAPQPTQHRWPHQFFVVLAALMLIAGFAGYQTMSGGSSRSMTTSASTNNGSGSSASGTTITPGPSASGSGSSATLTPDQIVAKVDPAIVDINTQLGNSGRAAGTGMIINSSGEILTNNHVVAGATSITVTLTSSQQSYPATLMGYDASHDVALLKIDNVSGLPTIQAASASSASVGDSVIAIGNALGKGGQPATAQGEITAVNQTITAGDETGGDSETLNNLLQMNAAIQPGDSGGATVNAAGNVIGMTTAGNQSAETTSMSTATIGYAVPIDDALAVVKTIESGVASGTVHLGLHGQLGVAVQPGDGQGVSVVNVAANSAAANVGIAEGDVITAVNGQSITSTNDLNDAMTATHVGDQISITWQDGSGSTQNATTTLTVGVG